MSKQETCKLINKSIDVMRELHGNVQALGTSLQNDSLLAVSQDDKVTNMKSFSEILLEEIQSLKKLKLDVGCKR